MSKLFVMVIGGSVITDRANPRPNLDRKNIERIASEIKKAQKRAKFDLVIVHGGGAFVHPLAKKLRISEKKIGAKRLDGAKRLFQSFNRLNKLFVTMLRDSGLKVIHFESVPVAVDKEKIVKISASTIKKFIKHGYIPVLQGYMVFDKSYGISILSSDHLGPFIAKELKCNLIIGGTSVDGLMDRDPSDPNAKLIKKVTPANYNTVKKFVVSPKYDDVTGGMARKLREYVEAAEHGMAARIINLTKPGILSETLLGKEHGTLISRK